MPRRNRVRRPAPGRGRSRRSQANIKADRDRSRQDPDAGQPRVRCPNGKAGYPEHVARAKLARILEREAAAPSSRRSTPVAVYPCGLCGSWHLTSVPR